MPPKRGPAARKLHDSLPPKTEIPCKIYSPLVITKEIGKGGFGRIYSGKTKDTKEDVAIKVEQNGSGGLFVEFQIFRSFLSEKDLNEYKKQKRLQFLGLPHFVAWGVFTHKGTELRFVAMPLYTGSLQEYINKKSGKVLDVDECKEIVPAVCDAYDYLHSKDIVHADLKAENLMFSKPYPNRLDRLTLIDFGMCGRRSHEIIDQPDKGKAHNGTALFTSTDAHRGCAPSYRADYEILGHNLLAWLAGVQNVPWNNIITKLDQVHSLKSKIIDSKGEIQKLVGSPEAASLVYEVYQVAKKTNYKDKVDSSKIKRLVSSIKSPKKSVTTPKSKKKSSAEQESPSSSAIVIPSSPPRPITPRKTKKSASEQPEISLEAQRRAQAEEREARAKRRNRVDAIPEEEEIENRKRRSEEPEDSGESKRSKVENKPKSPAKKAKKANSLDVTLSPAAAERLAKKIPGIQGFSRITKQMEIKYGSKK